jgi:hypothetical protein
LEAPGQEIPIRPNGRFEFNRVVGNGYWEREHLAGRVSEKTITGFYSEWDRMGSGAICGTGRPGKRAVHFTARP